MRFRNAALFFVAITLCTGRGLAHGICSENLRNNVYSLPHDNALPTITSLSQLTTQKLSIAEQKLMKKFSKLWEKYRQEFDPHEKLLTQEMPVETKQKIKDTWRNREKHFATYAQELSFQQRLKLTATAMLDFQRQGGKEEFPDPLKNEAYRTATMLNLSSRLGYQTASDMTSKRQLMKEHLVVSYIMAIYDRNPVAGFFREDILKTFAGIIQKHPELHLSVGERNSYNEKVLFNGSYEQKWELYIPKLDDKILNYLIFETDLPKPGT